MSEVVNKVFQQESAPRIRVATLNIAKSQISDLSDIAKAMTALDVDIIAIQEVDNKTRRSGWVDQSKKLAELSGMNVVFGKAIDFDQGEYGLAIASRHTIKHSEVLALVSDDQEARIVLKANIQVAGFEHPVTVFNTHLDTSNDPQLRLKQTRQLNKWTMNHRGIKLLLGDMNDVPSSQPYRELRRFWADALADKDDRRTWPASNPEINVDYIFTSPAQKWKILYAGKPYEAPRVDWPNITDHLPIVADMVLLEQ